MCGSYIATYQMQGANMYIVKICMYLLYFRVATKIVMYIHRYELL